ncbi:hypothetical protein ACWX0O_01690 [Nitrobacteraceae bacterium UC4449_H16]
MMTVQEARQRMTVNRMSMRNTGHGDYRVNFIECDREATAYYTDDLLDAVLTAGNMRRRMNDQLSRKYLATAS